jgi:hypothetical protein
MLRSRNSHRVPGGVLIVAAVGSLHAVAAAQSTPVSQVRSTFATFESTNSTQSAPDFNPWTNESRVNNTFGFSSARQTSNMNSWKIYADCQVSFATTGVRSRNIDVRSNYRYIFDVPATVPYTATGRNTAQQGVGTSTTFAELTGPTGRVFLFDGGPPVSLPFSASGSLAPGRYTLNVTVTTAGQTPQFAITGQSGIWVDLRLPCPADFNLDGTADFFDYLDFVSAWSAELPAGDFNRDGAIDFFDYLDFVAAFSAGC